MTLPPGARSALDHTDQSHADTVLEMPDGGGLPLYASFFGLNQAPFSIAPDPRYLFMSERHREALAHLLYGVSGGGGFVVLTGEIGAGKTTVCRCFLEQIPRRCNVAYIFNPRLTVTELLQVACTEFGVAAPPAGEPASTKAYVDRLNDYLLRTHAVGQNNVLIIDEAQNLSADVLEQLRLLTNLETAERKLLQIILIGQPELRDMLARPELEQLAQRVIARFHLDALSPDETRDYIHHRLAVAGYRREAIFDSRAARRVHQLTHGVPRRINLLCDRALLGAYSRSRATVDNAMVDTAAGEVFMPKPGKVSSIHTGLSQSGGPTSGSNQRVPWSLWALAGLGMAGLAFGLAWGWHVSTQVPVSARVALPKPLAPKDPAMGQPANRPSFVGLAPAVAKPASAPTAAPASVSAPPQPPMGMPLTWPTTVATSAADAVQGGGPLTLSAWGNEAQALRKLGLAWRQHWQGDDPCQGEGPAAQVFCYRSPAGLGLIRQLDRPVVLTLRDANHPEAFVILWGLDGEQVLIEGPKGLQTWPLAVVSSRWRGDFVALWQAPEGYRSKILPGQKGPALDWLATRLAQVDKGSPPALPAKLSGELNTRVLSFQVAQGLKADGVVGATTFMQLNRLTGINEPGLLHRVVPAPLTANAPEANAHVLHP
jgi:general secretion pathway protein A